MSNFRVILAGYIFFTSVSVLAASAPVCADLFAQPQGPPTFHLYQASHTLSQVVRDNAFDYWYWSKQNASSYFGKELAQEGLVVGDTHPGNFILGPLNGRIRFYIADVKDAGEASFILDFARLAMSTQAIFRRYDDRLRFPYTLEKMFDAYVDGLEGKFQEPPKDLQDVFKTSMSEYEDGPEKDYVEKHTAYDRIRFKTGKVSPFTAKATGMTASQLGSAKRQMSQAVRQSIPGSKVLDFGVRIRDRGGSKHFDRFWVLVQTEGKDQLVEFKEIGDPAVSQYQPQQETVERYNILMSAFWGGEDAVIQPVTVNGRLFFMRPKKVELFSVPYKAKDDETQKLVLKIASYDANYVGKIHARQMPTKAYVNDLKAHKDEIMDSIRHFSKDYLDRLEARSEARP